MSRGNNDEQFKFLISCIRHANNSKVDFSAVAKECGIVSKGAAAKRYERMMKAHGISTNTPPSRTTPAPPASRRETNPSSKKRKLNEFTEGMGGGAVDDDEGVVGVKEELGGEEVDGVRVKGENNADHIAFENVASAFTDVDAVGNGFSLQETSHAGHDDELQEVHFVDLGHGFQNPQPGEGGTVNPQDSSNVQPVATGVGMTETILISD